MIIGERVRWEFDKIRTDRIPVQRSLFMFCVCCCAFVLIFVHILDDSIITPDGPSLGLARSLLFLRRCPLNDARPPQEQGRLVQGGFEFQYLILLFSSFLD